jgi:hypothetical protein
MRRIPPYLAGTKKALALGSFVKKKGFPLREYFMSIDALNDAIAAKKRRAGGESEDDETLVLLLGALLNRDEDFLDYVLDTNYDISGDRDQSKWKMACEALAFTIIQEYVKAVENGKWP